MNDFAYPEIGPENTRKYYSNDGTPIIIDFSQENDGQEPVAAYRLGAVEDGFQWLPLEDELFLETMADGKEQRQYQFEDTLREFIGIRTPAVEIDHNTPEL